MWRLSLSLLGTLITILGFYLNRPDRPQWVIETFAPNYSAAVRAYDRILESGGTIPSQDPGFIEILSVVRDQIPELPDRKFTDIGFTNWGTEGQVCIGRCEGQPNRTIKIDLVELDGTPRSFPGEHDLRPKLEAKYLKKELSEAGAHVFWSGIVVVLLGLLAPYLQKLLPWLKRGLSYFVTIRK